MSQRDDTWGWSKNEEEVGRKKQDQPLKGAFTDWRDFKGNIHSAEFSGEKQQSDHPTGLHINSPNTVINFS